MKVYIVTDGDYSDYHIEAVFTDEEKAKIYAALHCYDNVEEYDADTIEIDGEFEPWIVHYCCYTNGFWHCEDTCYSKKHDNRVWKSAYNGVQAFIYLKERDTTKALKIAQDLYAEWLYEEAKMGGEIYTLNGFTKESEDYR